MLGILLVCESTKKIADAAHGSHVGRYESASMFVKNQAVLHPLDESLETQGTKICARLSFFEIAGLRKASVDSYSRCISDFILSLSKHFYFSERQTSKGSFDWWLIM
jgi:hypothetical protein